MLAHHQLHHPWRIQASDVLFPCSPSSSCQLLAGLSKGSISQLQESARPRLLGRPHVSGPSEFGLAAVLFHACLGWRFLNNHTGMRRIIHPRFCKQGQRSRSLHGMQCHRCASLVGIYCTASRARATTGVSQGEGRRRCGKTGSLQLC